MVGRQHRLQVRSDDSQIESDLISKVQSGAAGPKNEQQPVSKTYTFDFTKAPQVQQALSEDILCRHG